MIRIIINGLDVEVADGDIVISAWDAQNKELALQQWRGNELVHLFQEKIL